MEESGVRFLSGCLSVEDDAERSLAPGVDNRTVGFVDVDIDAPDNIVPQADVDLTVVDIVAVVVVDGGAGVSGSPHGGVNVVQVLDC